MIRLIIDILYLRDNEGNMIPKEIAIGNPDTNALQSWIIKPPFAWTDLTPIIQHTNTWYSKHMHGLDWRYGEVPFSQISQLLHTYTQNASAIYCFGLEKTKYLSNLLSQPIFNLQDLNCPPHLISLPTQSCCYPYHRFLTMDCALRQVHYYMKFLRHHDSLSDILHNQTINPDSSSLPSVNSEYVSSLDSEASCC